MKNKRSFVKTPAFAVIAVALACVYGIPDKFDINSHLFGFARVLLYFALLMIWSLRVMRTVQQAATRRYLLIDGVLMIFWLYVRTLKSEFNLSPTCTRICRYLYYLPMLFIPVAAFMAAQTIGRADDEK